MQTDGMLIRYVEHMKLRNLATLTIYCRERTLVRLGQWADGPVLYLSEQQLRAWQRDRALKVKSDTVRADASHVRQFYGWAQREGYRGDDPTTRLVIPRGRRRLPRPIADGALATAMARADVHTHVILALAAFAGLRACEVAALHWSDVTGFGVAGAYLRVEGKGGKDRKVPVSTILAKALAGLPVRRGPLIPRLDGETGPNSAGVISKRANLYLHKQGFAETLHQCRHRFATVALESCHDIRVVQELLGHESPLSTAIYTLPSTTLTLTAVEAAGQFMHEPTERPVDDEQRCA